MILLKNESTCPELPEGSFWNPDLGFRTADLMVGDMFASLEKNFLLRGSNNTAPNLLEEGFPLGLHKP